MAAPVTLPTDMHVPPARTEVLFDGKVEGVPPPPAPAVIELAPPAAPQPRP
jgi:hypothetical protein